MASRYVEDRNELIPLAEKEADRVAGRKPAGKPGGDVLSFWGEKWNRVFHREMGSLWAEAKPLRRVAP